MLDAQAPQDGLVIYTGVLYDATNLVFLVSAGTVRAAWQSTRQYWRFDVDTGQFVTASLNVGPQTLCNSFVSAAGLTATASGSGYVVAGLTRNDITHRSVAV